MKNAASTPSPIDRARRLPCWRGAVEARPLRGGLSNHNFVIEDAGADGKLFVARIGGDMPAHNVMRFNEQGCGRAAAEIGIAPKIIHAEDDALVIEYIHGETLTADAIRENLSRVIALLKKLHNEGINKLRGPVLAFSVFHVLRHYRKLLDEHRSHHAAKLPGLMDLAARLENAAGAVDIKLCHNDLLAANFIDAGDALYLIDWEHAGFNTPLFDLANLASNNDFPEAAERKMLKRYYRAPANAALWRRYKALRAASHLRETMWSMTAEMVSELDEDYAAYTEKNLAEFQRAFAQFAAL